jgi:hypothetical protein
MVSGSSWPWIAARELLLQNLRRLRPDEADERRANFPTQRKITMELLIQAVPVAAAGYSLVYLLAGGGLGGAIVIFIIAKMLGR